MADKNNADFRHHLTVDAPPQPIPKDMQGSDVPVPLSPQWLLLKPGENKLGSVAGESYSSPYHGNHPDAVRTLGNNEDFPDSEKKREIFRPSFYDAETGRRDRWRDEEREANSAIRRDRWREADKEPGDTRRIERRGPSDRWIDSGNREGSYDQRRESKWNTRWGPDVKESENRREKWLESSRDGEGSREKGSPNLTIQGRDTDREEELYSRSRRPNSSLIRGRGETSHHQSSPPTKPPPMFGYGRGRGENGASVFSAGRSRVNPIMTTVNSGSSRSYPLGFTLEKSNGPHGDPSTLRYSRMKLLDIYRTTDLKSHRMLLQGFIEVPSLTQEEPLEPLALSAPTSEESVILKGIDKGDIIGSVLPQVSKDGSSGRNSGDSVMPKNTRLGSGEDSAPAVGDCKDGSADLKGVHFNYLESPSYEKYLVQHGSDSKVVLGENLQPFQDNKVTVEVLRSEGSFKRADEAGIRDLTMVENSPSPHAIPWRSQSAGERSHGSSHGWQDFSTEARLRTSDTVWSHLKNDSETERKNSSSVLSSYFRDESQWQNSEVLPSELKKDSTIKRQSSEILDHHGKFQPHLSVEELTLYYKDPHGQIQGPFSGSDLIGWFEAGYFGIDLQVRVASAPAEAPFSSLGDVMPHLRSRARPPPGFAAAKQNGVVEASSRGKFSNAGSSYPGLGEFELIKNGQRNRQDGGTEAENRFLESLMSGNMNSLPSELYPFVEGIQGYGGSSSVGRPSLGGESMSDMNYLLTQRMSMERQRSLPTPLPYWQGRDPLPIGSKTDVIPESPTPHSKFLPPMGDNSRQIPQSSQNVDMLSLLQAAAEKSPSPAVNSAVPMWPRFPEVHSLNSTTQHLTSQTGLGAQHQRLHPQNHPSLPHILPQLGDLSPGLIPPEKLMAPEISQDPQMLSLLQQQYLLSQLHLQSQPPPPTQPSLLDRILFLQQQQQKQEQQQQQLLLQQQQHLLSQLLSGSQSHQHLGEPALGHLQALHEALQINQQTPVLNSTDGRSSNLSNPNLHGPHNVSYSVSTGLSAPHLPHQMFGHTAHSKEWDATLSQEGVETIPNSAHKPTPPMVDTSVLYEGKEKTTEEAFVAQKNMPPALSQSRENMTSIASEATTGPLFSEEGTRTSDIVSSVSEQVDALNISAEDIPEPYHIETPVVKEVKDVEVQEVKKASEKKSRKQKNSKTQPVSETGKGSSKTVASKQSKLDFEIEGANVGGRKSELHMEAEESLYRTSSQKAGLSYSSISAAESLDSEQAQLSSAINISGNEAETVERKSDQGEVGTLAFNLQTTSSHRAWKPAPGLRPKSFLEIQQEEQRRAQTETIASVPSPVVFPANSSPTPWVGVVSNADHTGKDIAQFVLENSENPLNSRSRKSQLHDLLAEEVLAKSNEGDTDMPASDEKGSSLSPLLQVGAHADIPAVVDDDFVEAKDTKKSRKKASKAKAAGLKASPPVASAYLSAPAVTFEKSKSARQAQQDKDLLPAPPSGPSLGDFVPWKEDQANSLTSPAWSTDSAKLHKPTSLRDILREQEKKAPSLQQEIPIPTPVKVQSNRGIRGSGLPWPVPGSSPSKAPSPTQTKAASPITTSLTSSHSKSRTEDDLFWGPLDQSKQETEHSDFPALANMSSWGAKGTSVKGSPGVASSRQKPSNSKPAEYAISSSPATLRSKGKKDAPSKHSEAMDFRDWCEGELLRLTGNNDMSFLEFCLKQSASEAEMLLRENLGSLDRNHEFIDKLLNYKDFLSSDVLEMAFRAQSSRRVSEDNSLASNDTGTIRETEAEGGGKKKAKRGKKVSPAVLGFNVVSNRIMMGEIQTVED